MEGLSGICEFYHILGSFKAIDISNININIQRDSPIFQDLENTPLQDILDLQTSIKMSKLDLYEITFRYQHDLEHIGESIEQLQQNLEQAAASERSKMNIQWMLFEYSS